MAKILVTGGAGYIGSVLVPMLLNHGHKVVVVDNFMYNQTSLLDCIHHLNLEVIRGNVLYSTMMYSQLPTIDYIIPLAAIVGSPACDKKPGLAEQVNFGVIKSLINMMSKNQRIIFPNTNSGYGIGQKDIHCDENTPMRPISLYGRTKVEAEKAVLSFDNAVVFRLATVFGMSSRMRLDLMVNDFVYRAVTDHYLKVFEGHAKRNFIHVVDVARAFLFAIENFNRMKGEVYNIGLSDANLSKLELCAEIKKQVPDFEITEGVGEDPDRRNYIVSNAKIEKSGFTAVIALKTGIAELVRGYQIIRKTESNNFSNA